MLAAAATEQEEGRSPARNLRRRRQDVDYGGNAGSRPSTPLEHPTKSRPPKQRIQVTPARTSSVLLVETPAECATVAPGKQPPQLVEFLHSAAGAVKPLVLTVLSSLVFAVWAVCTALAMLVSAAKPVALLARVAVEGKRRARNLAARSRTANASLVVAVACGGLLRSGPLLPAILAHSAREQVHML